MCDRSWCVCACVCVRACTWDMIAVNRHFMCVRAYVCVCMYINRTVMCVCICVCVCVCAWDMIAVNRLCSRKLTVSQF